MSVELINRYFETKNLIIKEAEFVEGEKLQSIYEEGAYLRDITGDDFANDHIHRCLIKGDLPPISNATKDNYRLMSIYRRETLELIVFFDAYHGYPENDIFWISYIFIKPNYQKSGYGYEVIDCLCKAVKECSYRNISIGVSMKNWLAIRFWIKCGFSKVWLYDGDVILSEDTMAFIGLEKELI